jgi:type VI secretion system protein ImpE
MSTAKELLDAGDLGAAIDEVTRGVKSNPTDMQQRVLLFELLCFAGEWDRAKRQLDVVGEQSATATIGVMAYHNNIKAEQDREALFSRGLQPHFLSEPPAYVDLHLDAINRLREDNVDEAREVLDRAEEERPAMSGTLNGAPFLDFRDYDDVVGPVLELIVQDKYTWVPLEHVRQVDISPPKHLRDLLWATTRLETTDGTIGEAFLLNLYAGSSKHPDDQVKLGRMTEWKKASESLYLGAGLRLFLVDDHDTAMLQVKNIQFDPVNIHSQQAPS